MPLVCEKLGFGDKKGFHGLLHNYMTSEHPGKAQEAQKRIPNKFEKSPKLKIRFGSVQGHTKGILRAPQIPPEPPRSLAHFGVPRPS